MSSEKFLSPALESYVEVIADLIEKKKVARVRDIAERKNVSMASVNGALRRLAEINLIKHNPYEFIELTDEGQRLARRMEKRHSVIRRFLQEVLHIHPKVADQDACTIEHHLSPETIKGLAHFFESWDAGVNPVKAPDPTPAPETPWKSLDEIPLHKKVTVKRLRTSAGIKNRLMEMGIIPGAEILVRRIAPLGDPIEIELKGYSLSLRRNEARTIEINE